MSDPIIGMHQWFETPPGRYLLAWERAEFERVVISEPTVAGLAAA